MRLDIERELKVPTPPLISINPMKPLWEACELLISTHARRLPLLDTQPTGEEVILSVLTQYRALKAIATNVCFVRNALLNDLSSDFVNLMTIGSGNQSSPSSITVTRYRDIHNTNRK